MEKMEKISTADIDKMNDLLTATATDGKVVLKNGDSLILNKAAKDDLTKKFRYMVYKPQMTAFDRTNPDGFQTRFSGFYVLFWISVGVFMIKTSAKMYHETGHWFNTTLSDLFSRDAPILIISDSILIISPAVCVLIQKAISRHFISWSGIGWIIQSLWETFYLGFTIYWTFHRDWPWIQTVYLLLHCIVLMMKQHSYGFYNGFLSDVARRHEALQKQIKVDQDRTTTDDNDEKTPLKKLCEKEKQGITDEIAKLEKTLSGPSKGIKYPANLTFRNFADYMLIPTLIYELEYPRTKSVRWSYIVEKSVAAVGVFMVMLSLAEHHILPKIPINQALSVEERLRMIPWVMLDIMPPLILFYLLTFYIIFECVLNVFAEITQFSDRGFYSDWWNSVTWDQFARDWNKPVHHFLLRHVYHSSISAFHLSKESATLITFFLSACFHELVMACITRKIRFYLLCMQMCQLPLVAISRTKYMKNRQLLGNVMFWIGLASGPSVLCIFYTMF